jgi:hypothetical protein
MAKLFILLNCVVIWISPPFHSFSETLALPSHLANCTASNIYRCAVSELQFQRFWNNIDKHLLSKLEFQYSILQIDINWFFSRDISLANLLKMSKNRTLQLVTIEKLEHNHSSIIQLLTNWPNFMI